MGDMLSQAEIDALLGTPSGGDDDVIDDSDLGGAPPLTDEERDILGEVGNISMGTSATTLYALLNQKVDITTPNVLLKSWEDIAQGYDRPCVGIRVDYTEGIKGSNILVLKERDVKIISSLMLGGDGQTGVDEPLSELDLSAISEAMNQMIGSSSTSLSSLTKMKIDIDTPVAFQLDFSDNSFLDQVGIVQEPVVCIQFRMEIGTLIDSNIMQILPQEFAVSMVKQMKEDMFGGGSSAPAAEAPKPQAAPQQAAPQAAPQQSAAPQPAPQQQYQAPPQQYQAPPQQQQDYGYGQQQYQAPPQQDMYGYGQQQYQAPPQGYYAPPPVQPMTAPQQYTNVQPASFQAFDFDSLKQQKENIDILHDVPLELTVELGRTNKKIREILEFTPGTILELDKLAGEPIDLLVNGKFVAKGEVIVIDENFGIRITDIISPEHRV